MGSSIVTSRAWRLLFWLAIAGIPPGVVPPLVAGAEQAAFGLAGGCLEVGVADPEHADRAFQAGGRLDLGTVLRPWLHVALGVSHWSADVDRGELGDTANGTISDLAFRTDLRWESPRVLGLHPYLLGGLAAHSVSADLPEDSSTEQALTGLNWGLDTGVGLLTGARGFRIGLELRRRLVNDVDGWAMTAGAGWFFPVTRSARVSRVAASRTPPAVAPVTGSTAVDIRPTAASRERDELMKVKELMTKLLQASRAQRAEIDSLRRVVQAITAVAPTGVASVTPGAPDARAPVRSEPQPPQDELRRALGRAVDQTGRPSALRESGDGLLLVLPGALLFGTASAELQIESREVLRRVALVLHRFPEVTVDVEGHADSRGNADANQRLSRERAVSVARELASLGVAESRLAAVGKGSSEPLGDNATAAGRALNRRVELRLRLSSPVR